MVFESKLKQEGDILDDVQREISYFRGKHNYDGDRLQNVLVYKGLYTSFETSTRSNIAKWKLNGVYIKITVHWKL